MSRPNTWLRRRSRRSRPGLPADLASDDAESTGRRFPLYGSCLGFAAVFTDFIAPPHDEEVLPCHASGRAATSTARGRGRFR